MDGRRRDRGGALALLPFFVAQRSTATRSARSTSRERRPRRRSRCTPTTQPYSRRWQALVVLALSLLVVSLDNTILNVALPTIREELDASSSQLQWIVDSYLLVFAGLLLAAGSLGDRFGRRRALFAGLAIFGARLAARRDLGQLDRADRLARADGRRRRGDHAHDPLDPHEHLPRGRAPARRSPIWAAVSGIGIAIGPITGGWLIEHFDWSSIFLVNLPVVAGGLIAGAVLIPESRDPESPRLDLPGTGLSIAGLTRDRLGAHRGARARLDQPDDPRPPSRAARRSLAAFVAWERRTDAPDARRHACSATCGSARRASRSRSCSSR